MMATAKTINLLVDCLICGFDRSDRNPRVLKCKHAFCEECLTNTRSIHTDSSLQCPVCMQRTELPQGGVAGLPVDTKATMARNALRKWEELFRCVLCPLKGETNDAVARCRDCEIRLCKECVKAHIDKPDFALHVIAENICMVHKREVSRACLTCRTSLCHECMVSELHHDHDICDVTEIREKASDLMAEGKHALQLETEKLDTLINTTMDQSLSLMKQKRKATEEKLERYRKEIHKSVNTWMDKRDEDYRRELTAVLDHQNEACSQATNCLNDINLLTEEKKHVVLEQILQKTFDMFQALEAVRRTNSKPVSVPNVAEDGCETTAEPEVGHFGFSCTLGRVVPVSMKIESKPKNVLSVKQLTPAGIYVGSLRHITALSDGSALLEQDNNYVCHKVNTKGTITDSYSMQNQGYYKGICSYNEKVYIGTTNGNKVHVVSGSSQEFINLRPSIQGIFDLTADKDHLLLVDNSFRLWQYSFRGDRRRTQCLQTAGRVNAGFHPDVGTVYLSSDWNNQYVKIYNPDFKLIRSIGGRGNQDGQFASVCGSTMLTNGNILVADSRLHRVSEFTFEGTFVRHLLTIDDGLMDPRDVAFAYPYLWVACSTKAMLFTYE